MLRVNQGSMKENGKSFNLVTMILLKTKAGSLKHTIVLRGIAEASIYAGTFSRRWKLGKMNQAEIDELLRYDSISDLEAITN